MPVLAAVVAVVHLLIAMPGMVEVVVVAVLWIELAG